MRRVVLCGALLTCGLAAQASLESFSRCERPPLRRSLASLPMELGDWIGRDVPMDPKVLKEAQATEYLNRIYENRYDPAKRMALWINYSQRGANLRHSPKICLPSGGWTVVEPMCGERSIAHAPGKARTIMRLGYAQGELVQEIGFWYYIFGEGRLERYVRGLPITSRSSHGQTTRGSGMTVEVFCPGENDPDGEALEAFASPLLSALEPLLPTDRAEYYIP
jgi:hypothetical protein